MSHNDNSWSCDRYTVQPIPAHRVNHAPVSVPVYLNDDDDDALCLECATGATLKGEHITLYIERDGVAIVCAECDETIKA